MSSYTQDFSDPTQCTYDTALVEITGGKAQLKNNRPSDNTFYASYKTTIDATECDGTDTGTASGGAAIASEWLDLAHNDIRYVDYNATSNADSQQILCIEFDYKPNYSGAPVGHNMTPFNICKADNDLINMVTMYHFNATGMIVFQAADDAGVLRSNKNVGVWSPTADTVYHFSINCNFTTGNTKIFIDGTQFGATIPDTLTRSADIGLLRIGSNYINSYGANFSIRKVRVFNAVQHTSNYTPSTFELYSMANPTVEINLPWYMEGLEGFTATETKTGNDEIKYLNKKGTSWYYYNSGWIASDGTYFQSTTAADTETNKATFTTSLIIYKVKLFLHSDNGDTTPSISLLIIDFDYGGPGPDTIEKCIVFGYSKKADGTVDQTSVTAKLNKGVVQYKNYTGISGDVISDTPESVEGLWELELVETTNMESDAFYIVTYESVRYKINNVPNEATKAFWDLSPEIY